MSFVAGELMFGALGGYLSYSAFRNPCAACTFNITMVGAAAGALGYDYLAHKDQGKTGRSTWPINNPVTFTALTATYGSIMDVLLELVLPEFELGEFGRLTLTAVAFGFGGYTAYNTGPTVGNLVEMLVWGVAETMGYDWPTPPAVKSSSGVKSIPSIAWNTVLDIGTKAVWEDSIKPIIEDFKDTVKDGKFQPLYLFAALFETILAPGNMTSGAIYQVVKHFTDIIAAILHSVKF